MQGCKYLKAISTLPKQRCYGLRQTLQCSSRRFVTLQWYARYHFMVCMLTWQKQLATRTHDPATRTDDDCIPSIIDSASDISANFHIYVFNISTFIIGYGWVQCSENLANILAFWSPCWACRSIMDVVDMWVNSSFYIFWFAMEKRNTLWLSDSFSQISAETTSAAIAVSRNNVVFLFSVWFSYSIEWLYGKIAINSGT